MKIKNILLNFLLLLKNPKLYIAAVAGTIPGVISGGLVGLVSGSFIAPFFGVFAGYKDHQFGIDVDLIVGGAFGLIIGVILGGGLTAMITLITIHKSKNEVVMLSQDNMAQILLPALSISTEIAVGMLVGAIIGSLKLLGLGTVIGAALGIVLILLARALIK